MNTEPRQSRMASPDLDLAIAFFGSVISGIFSGATGGYWAGKWQGAGLGATLGIVAGIPWGFLSVIVAAIAAPASRRKTIYAMLAILALILKVTTFFFGIAIGEAG